MAGSPLPFHDASVRPKSATHDAKLYCLSLPPISSMATACTAASSPVSVSVRELNLGPLKIRRRDALRWRQVRREGGREEGRHADRGSSRGCVNDLQARRGAEPHHPNRVGSRLNLGISPLSLPPSPPPAFPLPSSSSKPTHAYRQSREPPARVERVGARAGAAYAI